MNKPERLQQVKINSHKVCIHKKNNGASSYARVAHAKPFFAVKIPKSSNFSLQGECSAGALDAPKVVLSSYFS